MNDSRAQIRFERLWTRGVLLFVAVFLLYFVTAEREGLWRLVVYIGDQIGKLPHAVADIAADYGRLTP